MPPKAAPRLYPLEPLLRVAGRYRYESVRATTAKIGRKKLRGAGTTGTTVLVEVCGLSGREIAQARHTGLTDAQADRCALRIGCHPAEIWGDEWWDGADARDRTDIIFAALRRELA